MKLKKHHSGKKEAKEKMDGYVDVEGSVEPRRGNEDDSLFMN